MEVLQQLQYDHWGSHIPAVTFLISPLTEASRADFWYDCTRGPVIPHARGVPALRA
jgi:hypothetical protein